MFNFDGRRFNLKFVRLPRPQPRFRFSPLPLFLPVSHGDDVEVDAAAGGGDDSAILFHKL